MVTMNRKKRKKNLIFKVNEDEWKIIQKRLDKCNVSSMSELFRQMMIHGIYLEYDHEELKQIRKAVMSVSNNINQIAFRVNSTGNLYKQDIADIQEGVNTLWHQLQSIQSELQRLNPSNIS